MDSSRLDNSRRPIPASISSRTSSVLINVQFPRLPLPRTETVTVMLCKYGSALGQPRGNRKSAGGAKECSPARERWVTRHVKQASPGRGERSAHNWSYAPPGLDFVFTRKPSADALGYIL